MATNRTGTGRWIKVRNQRRRIDLDNGVFNCPICRVPLDWEYSGRPNSAEVDHIIPHAKGGQDTLENTRSICRRCNQSLGGRQNKGRIRNQKPKIRPLKISPRG